MCLLTRSFEHLQLNDHENLDELDGLTAGGRNITNMRFLEDATIISASEDAI